MTEIPFWFHDRPKWVSGIGRQTTCQDILHSLVKAHWIKTKGANCVEDSNARSMSQSLVIVEQWRGVERPLSNSSKILKLWSAWGEERDQVRFVVKKISSNSTNEDGSKHKLLATCSSTNSLSRNRKTRRRNSRLSSMPLNSSSSANTLHPKALKSYSSTGDIEKLMKIILTQGETIHNQLKRLQEREGQIETIEEEVHASRTKTAGKNYLINAYLENLSDGENHRSSKRKQQTSENRRREQKEIVPENLHEMLDALTKVHELNEKLTSTEEQMSDLQCKVRRSRSADSCSKEHNSIDGEVNRLRALNDKIGREIDQNKHLISSMQSTFDERKALVKQLEQDVHHIESEGNRLRLELEKVTNQSFFDPTLLSASDLYEPEDEDLMNDLYRLSSSQLYEDAHVPSSTPIRHHSVVKPPRSNEDEEKLFIKTGGLDHLLGGPSSSCTDTARINATGSPGSSTSGNSSSGCGTGSEKSVRFSERDLILATPDLPPIPPDYPSNHHLKSPQGISQFTKSILKAVDPSGDLDSNSDTGLSSLHSSSDEGTNYVLDTLV